MMWPLVHHIAHSDSLLTIQNFKILNYPFLNAFLQFLPILIESYFIVFWDIIFPLYEQVFRF